MTDKSENLDMDSQTLADLVASFAGAIAAGGFADMLFGAPPGVVGLVMVCVFAAISAASLYGDRFD